MKNTENHNNTKLHKGKDGHLHVKNLLGYWLPDVRLQRKIGGTVYTVSGSYEGTATLDRKLRRILLQGGDIHDR